MTEPERRNSLEKEKISNATKLENEDETRNRDDDENDSSKKDGKTSGPLSSSSSEQNSNNDSNETSWKQQVESLRETTAATAQDNSKPPASPKKTINRLRQSARRMGSLVKHSDVEAAVKSATNNLATRQPSSSSLDKEPELSKTPQEPSPLETTTPTSAVASEEATTPDGFGIDDDDDKSNVWLTHVRALKGEYEIQRLETQRSSFTTLTTNRFSFNNTNNTGLHNKKSSWDASVHSTFSEWTAPKALRPSMRASSPQQGFNNNNNNNTSKSRVDESLLMIDGEEYSYVEESVNSFNTFGIELGDSSHDGGGEIPSVLKCNSDEVEVDEEVTEHDDDEDDEDDIIVEEPSGIMEEESVSGDSSYFESGGSEEEGAAEKDSVGSCYTLEADTLSCQSEVTLWSDEENGEKNHPARITNNDDDEEEADDEESDSSSSYLDITVHDESGEHVQ